MHVLCKIQNEIEKGKFQVFRFPSILLYQGKKPKKISEQRLRQWLANISRADLDDAKADHSRVCSNQFISGNPIMKAMN